MGFQKVTSTIDRPEWVTPHLWVALALVLASCSSAGYGGQSAAADRPDPGRDWIVGQWSIQSESGSGPSMVIVMDSVIEGTIHGHVLRYMSGNVGRGPGDFLPFAATQTTDGLIPVTVEMSDSAAPPIRVVFQRSEDSLEVREFVLGAEDMTARGRRWVTRRLE